MEAKFIKVVDLLAGFVQGTVGEASFRAEYAAIKAEMTTEDLAELNTRVINFIVASRSKTSLIRLLK